MQTIPRIIFDRVGLRLPANAKALLNVRQMDVYDILQLLVNTVNAVVKANDGNIDKEERFLAALNEALDKWAGEQEASIEGLKNSVINYIQTGEWSTEGFITSPSAFGQEFWTHIAESLLDEGDVLAPGAEGNTYSRGGEVEPGSCWVLRLKMWGGGYNFIEVTDLMTNLQIDVDEEKGAVFTDNNENFAEIGNIPYASDEGGGLMSKKDWVKLKGIYVDEQRNLLYIDGKAYKVEPYVKPETQYEYLTPYVIEFSYDDIDANGGMVRPFVEVNHQVKIVAPGSGVYRNVIITATYHYDEESGKMAIDYTNGDYMKADGGLELEFSYQSLPSNVSIDKNGVVSKTSASTSSERDEVAVVTVKAKINGIECEASSIPVYQKAAAFSAKDVKLASTASKSFFDIPKSSGIEVTEGSIASTADWFVITKTEIAANNIRVYYDVSANNNTAKRTANVTAMTNMSDKAIVIANVEQSAEAQSITASVTSDIDAGASDFIDLVLTKTAGVTLTEDNVRTDADWITVTAVEIENTRVVITYTADANPSTSKRTGHIYVDTNLGANSSTITIRQAAKAVINATPSSLSFTGEAGGASSAKSVTITGLNLVEAIAVSITGSAFKASTKSISASAAGKSGGTTLTITFSPPATAGDVSGTVVLSSKNADDVEIALSGAATGSDSKVTAYYGATDSAPSTKAAIEQSYSKEINGTDTIAIGGARCPWVAVPTGTCTVTCKDGEGEGGGDNVNLTIGFVGEYTVYSFPMPFVMPTTPIFTISIK